MSAEEHDQNGNGADDDPLFPQHRPPLRLLAPRPDATPTDVARASTNAILAIGPRVNAMDRDIEKLTIAVLAMPGQLREMVREAVRDAVDVQAKSLREEIARKAEESGAHAAAEVVARAKFVSLPDVERAAEQAIVRREHAELTEEEHERRAARRQLRVGAAMALLGFVLGLLTWWITHR